MKKHLLSLLAIFAPALALAQGVNTGYFEALVSAISTIVNDFLVPIVIALAVLVFLWGVFNAFILGGSDEGKRADGRKLMLWGIIAFVVMGALWGIVNLVAVLFGVNPGTTPINAPGTPPVGV